ncbi:MAG: band 7 protein [Elusimicrobia bacterium GWC2_65_9]|nr:MAG: band 7 protein [Elusimicrobia bacterium GWA2_66_18]OGR73389.1 MAG: band 7 protein [Elusimicrobia bacterium GWC2_65_9]
MNPMALSALATFAACFVGVPILLGLLRLFGCYTIVYEGTAKVYVLFGNVLDVIQEPGLHFLWFRMGPAALIVNWIGSGYTLDMRMDQVYRRSEPVNSEEGAPMGIGIWYEMFISDPVAYIFKNADPRGSLAANVSNATVRSLSNMKLADMLGSRHQMSQVVREEVSPKSHEWGYKLGSVYIRKVHFRDPGMIRQIEEKVVNRLRQVTSAIKQDGENQVNIIASTAQRQASIAFGEAAALRPKIVGQALKTIGSAPDILEAMFEILEVQKSLEGGAAITLVPEKSDLISGLIASRGAA